MSLIFCFFCAMGWSASVHPSPPAPEEPTEDRKTPGPAEELLPVVIKDEPLGGFYPRSVQWPATKSPLPSRKLTPDLADTLNSSGEIQVRTQGSPTISIRGSSQSGRVLSLFDDVPLNFSSGFGTPFLLVPKEIVSDVSVMKGPASLFYGSQAMGGSVHFVPGFVSSPELHVSISDTDESVLPWRAGSLANHSVALVAPVTSRKKSQRQVSVFTENDDGQFPYSSDGINNVRTNNSSQLNRLTLLGKEDFQNVQLEYDIVAGNEIRTIPGAINFPSVIFQKSKGLLASIAPRFRLSDSSQLKTRSSSILLESDYEMGGMKTFYDQKTFIQQTDYQYRGRRWKLKIFGDMFAHTLNTSSLPNRLTEESFEAGPVVSAQLSSDFSLQGGARNLFGDNVLLTNFGAFYRPEDAELWIQFSEGFRRPSLSDRFASTPGFVANPNLNPEKSNQVEVGYRYQPKKSPLSVYKSHLTGEIRAYNVQYRDFFETQTVSPNQIQKVNRGQGQSYGIDSQLGYSWGPWVLDFKYSFLKTKNKTLADEPFRLSPEHQWSASATHFIGPFGFRLQNIIWRKAFDREVSGTLRPLPDWNQWNIEFFSYGFRKTNFNVGVTNVFGASKQYTLFYPEPERRYWAQIHWRFN